MDRVARDVMNAQRAESFRNTPVVSCNSARNEPALIDIFVNSEAIDRTRAHLEALADTPDELYGKLFFYQTRLELVCHYSYLFESSNLRRSFPEFIQLQQSYADGQTAKYNHHEEAAHIAPETIDEIDDVIDYVQLIDTRRDLQFDEEQERRDWMLTRRWFEYAERSLARALKNQIPNPQH